MTLELRVPLVLLAASLAAVQPVLAQANPSHKGLDLNSLLGLHRQTSVSRHVPTSAPDAVALGLASAKVYKFSTADYPGGDLSLAFDANISTVVGGFLFPGGNANAFTLANGVYRILTVPGAAASLATGINTSGQIVGGYAGGAPSATHGFLDNAGTFTTIDFPSSTSTIVYDVNDGGVIVGIYSDAANVQHGFVDNAGVFTTIDPPGSTSTTASGINTGGDVVGAWTDATNLTHGFLLSGGVFTPLDFPTATSTSAFGINDSGEISGFYADAASVDHGFIYSGAAWSRVDVAGAASTELAHIKNNGVITGEYTDDKSEEHGIRGH